MNWWAFLFMAIFVVGLVLIAIHGPMTGGLFTK
jgi:hypothetical protein